MQTFLALVIVMVSATHISIEPCPSSPNCVSSQATDNHFIEPLAISGEAKAAFERLKAILEQRRDTTIVTADDKEIRVEFKTTLGFVDDGLFVLDAENRVIQIRSASRAGYWDFGKNRRRLEKIRKEFLARAE
jgi:uncharacterized protein (DUF1499 family)